MSRFKEGDEVMCVTHQYESIRFGERRTVLEVIPNSNPWDLIKLRNAFSPIGTSNYTSANFKLVKPKRKKEQEQMAYERIKYFAIKLNDPDQHGNIDGATVLSVDVTTPLRDSKHQVQIDVGKHIQHGEQWLLVSTVALIEGEAPRPPIRVTEYK